MSHRVVVSIINYRTGEMTLACVRSALADLEGIDGRVVVVDNASGDGSAEMIEAWIAAQEPPVPVTLVRSATNSGFSGGHNQGFAAAAAEFYLILNSDALLRRGFLAAMLAAAAADPGSGILAPRIEYEDGTVQTSCFRFHGPLSELIRVARTGPVTRVFARHEVALGPDPDPTRIEWASGACLMFRGDMIAAIGPMDEGYFLYYEDAEYCLRARRAGWRLAYVPQAVAVHFRGGSGPVKTLASARRRLPAYYYASRSRFLYQAHGRASLLAANLLCYAGWAVAQLGRLAGKRKHPVAEKELADIWTNFSDPLGPRRAPGETA
jgi:N-acetylglucosaminyl-diphospho-decaprenol L-rhamnosyltransferase